MGKTFSYYIDESGHINNDSFIFLYGCIKTDTPIIESKKIEKLRNKLKEELYFAEHFENKDTPFHAVEDHPDIRSEFYKLLPFLNIRAYYEIILKNGSYFETIKKERKDHEIIKEMLTKLIFRSVGRNRRNEEHIFYVEELEIEEKTLSEILNEIKNDFSYIKLKFEILSKGNYNLSIIDYLNYIIYNIFEPDPNKYKKITRQIQNFNIVKEKIALMHIWNSDVFLGRRGSAEKQVELDNIRNFLVEGKVN